jgi:hypothetical protein
VGLIVLGVLLTALIGPWWYATPDAAAYLSIGRRLAHGAAPHAFGQSQPSYPLGYPALITPAFWVGDRPFLALAMINWLLAVLFMLGTYRWMRRVAPEAALLLTALVMANVNVWNLYRRNLSEVVFLPLLMWTIALTDGALTARSRVARSGMAVGVALLLVGLTATRETGLLVALGVTAAALMSSQGSAKRRPLVTAGVLAMALGGLLLLRPERRAAATNAMRDAFSAGHESADGAFSAIGLGLHRRLVEVAQLTVPGMFKGYTDPPTAWDPNMLAGLAIVGLVAAGWYRLVRRRPDALVLLAPLYFAVLVLWPYASGARYVLPLLPLLVACGWEAWEPFGRWRRYLIALTIIAHFTVAAGYWWLIDLPRVRACSAQWPAVERHAAAAIPPRPAAARSLPACVRLMFQLALDRPVHPLGDAEPIPDKIHWLLTHATDGAASAFRTVRHESGVVLQQRIP